MMEMTSPVPPSSSSSSVATSPNTSPPTETTSDVAVAAAAAPSSSSSQNRRLHYLPTQNNDDCLYDRHGVAHAETSTTTTTSTLDWTVEICICFLPLLLGILLEYLQLPPNERPIPYQYIQPWQQQGQGQENNNDNNDEGGQFILNQVYNEILAGTSSQGGETVTSAQLILYSVVLPFIIQLSLSWYQYRYRSRSCCGSNRGQHLSDLHDRYGGSSYYLDSIHCRTVCVYFVAIGTVIATTDMIKLYVGYLRPVFYDSCQPEEQQQDNGNDNINNNDPYYLVCSDDDNNNAREARLSFPSGHASISVCGLLLLSQFLEQQCFGQTAYNSRQQSGRYPINHNTQSGGEQLYDDSNIDEGNHRQHQQRLLGNIVTTDGVTSPTPQPRQHLHTPSSRPLPPGRIVRKRQLYRRFIRIISMLCYSPMLLALFIASSRVHDNKHFPADVVGGSLLGGTIAVLVHGIWFPLPTAKL